MSDDERRITNQQRRSWDAAAAGRALWTARMEPALAPVTAALLEIVAEGHWALDVCCGAGNVAFAAAARVGAQGRVVGIDVAPKMVAAAEARARAEAVSNTGFQVLDAAQLVTWPEGSYDVALSRFGISFVPDLDAVVRGLHHVLVPGGRVALASWSGPDDVPLLGVARRAIAAALGAPASPPDAPGPFALARPGRLEQILSSRGFVRIEGRPLEVSVEFPSAADYVAVLREATSLGALVAEATVDDAERAAAAWEAVAAAAPDPPRFVCRAFSVSARRG